MADELRAWLAAHAQALDDDSAHASEVVPQLGAAGLFRIGVARDLSGEGGSVWDAVEAIAGVAELSLAAAFTFWGQRAFIHYLIESPNAGLRDEWLPPLLPGEVAGATGLSNAMKFLGGIEALGINAVPEVANASGRAGWKLRGQVPWCTNLREPSFIAAVAVATPTGPVVAALPSSRAGVVRSADLDLIALRGSNTASLSLDDAQLHESDLLHADANAWLPRVRPGFLGLQCGLSIGLARASLRAAAERQGAGRSVLEEPLRQAHLALEDATRKLREGLGDGRFLAQPAALFRLRLSLADVVQQAVQLELQASGGRAYHRDQPLGFARRWHEAAFIPIVTPSVTQLQGALAALAKPAGVAV